MRKTLLASLVLAALAAPAFAENSVTIYGQANAALEYVNNGSKDTGTAGKVSNFRVDAGSNLDTPSRLGFKGVETLSDGLNAWFQVETTLNLQDPNNNSAASSSQFGDREAWVGLQGTDWGKVGLGHGKTPYVNLADKEDGLVYGANNLQIYNVNKVVVGNLNDTNGVITKRPINSIRYDSPVWGGFSFATSYSFGENKTATTPASGDFSLAANWTDGMFFVGGAYQSDNNIGATPNNTSFAGISGNKQNAGMLLGTVKFDGFLIGLDGQVSTTDLTAGGAAPVTETKRSAVGLWGTYSMDAWTFKAGLVDFANAKVNGATISDSGDVRYMVGTNFNFSKQTVGFIEFAGDQNKGKVASKDATMPKGTLVNSATPTWLSIGLSHAF